MGKKTVKITIVEELNVKFLQVETSEPRSYRLGPTDGIPLSELKKFINSLGKK
jgi:hypothetical protein